MGIENVVLPTDPGAESPSAPSVSRCTLCAWNWVGLRNTCCISKILHSPDFALLYLPFVERWEVKTKLHKIGCVLWEILLGSPTPSKCDSVLEQEWSTRGTFCESVLFPPTIPAFTLFFKNKFIYLFDPSTSAENLNLSIYKSQELPVANKYNFFLVLWTKSVLYLISSTLLHIYYSIYILVKIHASSLIHTMERKIPISTRLIFS